MLRTSWVALTVLATASCGLGDAHKTSAIRSDSAGVALVLNDGQDRDIVLQLDQDYVLGGAEEGPESFYSLYPRDVSVGMGGRIAILNRPLYEVVVFDTGGQHIVSFGQQGEGPGEFSYPSALVVLPDSRTGVYDFGKRRIEVFDSVGVYVGPWSAATPSTIIDMAATGQGLLIESRAIPRGGGASSRQVVFMSDRDAVNLAPQVASSAKSIRFESCGVSMTLPPLFSADLAWSSNGARTAIVGGPEYSIMVYEDTTLQSVIRRDIVPQKATESLAMSELGDGEKWQIGSRECTVPAEEVIEQRGLAAFVPLIIDVMLTPNGELWVLRRAVSGAQVIDLFDSSGEYVGTSRSALPFPITFLPDGRSVTIETDDLDVQRLVVSNVTVERR